MQLVVVLVEVNGVVLALLDLHLAVQLVLAV